MQKYIFFILLSTAILCAKQIPALKTSLEFSEVPVPMQDKEKRAVNASSKVTMNGVDYTIGYHTILRSGQKVGENTFGLIYDNTGHVITDTVGSVKLSHHNDFSSLIQKGKSLFMISHFETTPAAMYITQLDQNKSTGELTAVKTKNIDFSAFNGLWSPCAGSVTPWNTHLGSEEYPPDASTIDVNGSIGMYYDPMVTYVRGDLKVLNPYDYGWIPEVEIVDEKGSVKVQKHYSMGRFSHELAYVMPDKKTVYLADDGSNVIFYKFVADKEEDLSAGRLYAAKWIQTSAKGGGSARIKWIDLGHATDAEIKQALVSRQKFTDIFTVANRKSDNTCPQGFRASNWAYKNECLQVKKGMRSIASRLESGRYASMLGATSEFTKMEGITYNPIKNEIYMSMSRTEKAMEDYKYKEKPESKYDKGGNNDIRLEARNHCGVVYKLSLAKYNVIAMTAMIQGTPMPKDANGNTCKLDNISMPDNLTFIPQTGTLIIGEDTNYHQNDMVWAYQIKSKKLTRILTAPYGAEMTSMYYYPNINGFGYLMSVVQHPYGESDRDKQKTMDERRAYTGYIGPLPLLP